jgi:hypothetical protein
VRAGDSMNFTSPLTDNSVVERSGQSALVRPAHELVTRVVSALDR